MNEETLLSDEQLETALKSLHVAWSAIPGQGLVRVFTTNGFNQGVALITQLAEIAEAHNHHPELHLTYDELEVTLTTHSAGGVTQKDIELAQAIDTL